MQIEDQKVDAKFELVQITGALMPGGKPKYLQVVQYPKISDMVVKNGSALMLKIIFLIVKDFCSSVNVVRNMNDSQMIEAASMLLDECENFRLEDYMMMFAMAKRGDLVKIFDRLDMSVITAMMDEYWIRRKSAGKAEQEESIQRLDGLGNTTTQIEMMNPQDAKMIKSIDGISGAFDALKSKISRVESKIEAKEQIEFPETRFSYGTQADGQIGFISHKK